ncbi:MAG: hypothetical protein A2622_10090 [Bdellovibrionales bacterium RIFCSPHIGHO2_01_FULL_40_29]|nr:MAG: hypothetical protein A2622_10090 [Bdellovibrionales bacterium RIFCSPHIGHO2_01_FULL_40_29]OFZ32404.1 MAG: hypothetical protein A3D17_12570 [Bdellovibrionales bacterium RIFCSPHIGHO2_02_FULL_40_15]
MNQKTVTILSMSLVVFGAVMVNEFVLKSGSADQDRAVASFGERFEPNQIKWEQELATAISKDDKAKTVIGIKPNPQDKMLFEIFEGRYEAQLNQGKVNRIALLPHQSPLEINTSDFMKEYADVMKEFDTYEVSTTSPQNDSIRLKGKNGEVVGNMTIQRDDKGRVLSIEVQ